MGGWERGEEERERTYLHVVENGIAKRDKVAVCGVEDVEIAPAVEPEKGGPGRGVRVCGVWGDEGIGETHDGGLVRS